MSAISFCFTISPLVYKCDDTDIDKLDVMLICSGSATVGKAPVVKAGFDSLPESHTFGEIFFVDLVAVGLKKGNEPYAK